MPTTKGDKQTFVSNRRLRSNIQIVGDIVNRIMASITRKLDLVWIQVENLRGFPKASDESSACLKVSGRF